MSEQTPSTPVTDDEQWSDETEGSSPQHAGYTPLDQQQYQALGEEDEEEDDGGAAAGNDAGVGGDRSDHDEAGHAQEAWREAAEDGGRGSPQYDVASVMLRAIEADYRACVESEGRAVGNGPIAPAATATATTENQSGDSAQVQDNGDLSSGQEQPVTVGEEGLDVAKVGAPSPPPPPPPRPISPLGQDQAERVMRAMQGFALSAPPPAVPPARFEADWGSPDALANLATAPTNGTTAETTGAPQEEEEQETIGRNTAPANDAHR